MTEAAIAAEPPRRRIGDAEFVALMALAVAMPAFSIDAMLPALPAIGAATGATIETRHFVLVAFMAGIAAGPLLFGIASDRYGRRPVLFAGLLLYLAGSAIILASDAFSMVLVGRALQGFGAAGPRTLVVSIVRDRYAGREMARVMSFVMTVFILAPVIAPTVGLGVMHLGGWRAIFWFLAAVAAATLVWSAVRLPETLSPEARRPISARAIAGGVRAWASAPGSVLYVVALGGVFGGMVTYLNLVQPVVGEVYGFGDGFALVFGALAMMIGAATLSNAALVMRLGMARLAGAAMAVFLVASAGSALSTLIAPTPPFWIFILFCAVIFFAMGLLFGNLNALAMEPLGHVAGIAGALGMTVSFLIGLALGTALAARYDGTATAITEGLALCAAIAAAAYRAADAQRRRTV